MADLSQADLDWIRDQVGSTPSDDALAAHFDDLGNRVLVALRVLRRRLADMTASPANFSLSGKMTVGTDRNIIALTAKISELETLVGADEDVEPGSVTSTFLRRPDYR